MGRSENWVKNNWRRVLKREKIATDTHDQAQLSKRVEAIIEKLTTETEPPKENLEDNMLLDDLVTVKEGMKDIEYDGYAEENKYVDYLGSNYDEKLSTTAKSNPLTSNDASLHIDYDAPSITKTDAKNKGSAIRNKAKID